MPSIVLQLPLLQEEKLVPLRSVPPQEPMPLPEYSTEELIKTGCYTQKFYFSNSEARSRRHGEAQFGMAFLYSVGAAIINQGLAEERFHIRYEDSSPIADISERDLTVTTSTGHSCTNMASAQSYQMALSLIPQASDNGSESKTKNLLQVAFIAKVALDHMTIPQIKTLFDALSNPDNFFLKTINPNNTITLPNGSVVHEDLCLALLCAYVFANPDRFGDYRIKTATCWYLCNRELLSEILWACNRRIPEDQTMKIETYQFAENMLVQSFKRHLNLVSIIHKLPAVTQRLKELKDESTASLTSPTSVDSTIKFLSDQSSSASEHKRQDDESSLPEQGSSRESTLRPDLSDIAASKPLLPSPESSETSCQSELLQLVLQHPYLSFFVLASVAIVITVLTSGAAADIAGSLGAFGTLTAASTEARAIGTAVEIAITGLLTFGLYQFNERSNGGIFRSCRQLNCMS